MSSSTKFRHQRVEAAADDIEKPFVGEGAIADPLGKAEETLTPEPTEISVPRDEYDRLKADRDQLFDRLARLQAEFDNARKREVRERAEFRDYALVSAVEQFLPVLDNFQLALRSEGSAEQLRTGVELIVRQMEEILRSLGVQAVATKDAIFDPRVHEALEMVERTDLPDHQVMEEVRRGYTLRDRLLRPALVRVASNPRQHKA
ncbi:MAG TPA: nucleotide exchange factor GrpE [Acidobacteriaceae bacterium]|jgi:molecular chaperone GrpE|nr:nucleotide exchange factor GrpE [Acidobacteriaceae bacterium]